MTHSLDWHCPITKRDYLRMPGVEDVEDGVEPGVVTLIVSPGCEGLARILHNAGVVPINLELRERTAKDTR